MLPPQPMHMEAIKNTSISKSSSGLRKPNRLQNTFRGFNIEPTRKGNIYSTKHQAVCEHNKQNNYMSSSTAFEWCPLIHVDLRTRHYKKRGRDREQYPYPVQGFQQLIHLVGKVFDRICWSHFSFRCRSFDWPSFAGTGVAPIHGRYRLTFFSLTRTWISSRV